MTISIEVWNPGKTEKYGPIESEVEGITYGSMDPGGFSVCSFELKRNARVLHEDLTLTNYVKVSSGRKLVWEGRIANLGRFIGDGQKLGVQCDGLMERLNSRRTTVSVSNGQKGSAWIVANLIADGDMGLSEGEINTGDWVFPLGVDNSPNRPYAEALESINRPNGYSYGIWDDASFDYHPKPTVIDYYIDIEDCESQFDFGLENIINYLYYSRTEDESNYVYATISDADSIAKYGRRDGELAIQGKVNAAQALATATIYLNEKKIMRPKSAVTARRITDADGNEIPTDEARSGKLVHIRGLFTGELTHTEKQAVNEMSTFHAVEVMVDSGKGTVALAPGESGVLAEKMLARWEAMFGESTG